MGLGVLQLSVGLKWTNNLSNSVQDVPYFSFPLNMKIRKWVDGARKIPCSSTSGFKVAFGFLEAYIQRLTQKLPVQCYKDLERRAFSAI